MAPRRMVAAEMVILMVSVFEFVYKRRDWRESGKSKTKGDRSETLRGTEKRSGLCVWWKVDERVCASAGGWVGLTKTNDYLL